MENLESHKLMNFIFWAWKVSVMESHGKLNLCLVDLVGEVVKARKIVTKTSN